MAADWTADEREQSMPLVVENYYRRPFEPLLPPPHVVVAVELEIVSHVGLEPALELELGVELVLVTVESMVKLSIMDSTKGMMDIGVIELLPLQ